MLIDIRQYAAGERPAWSELERLLDRIENEPELRLSLDELRRLQYLYQRAAAGLTRLRGVEPELARYLEVLVGRAYSEIHETRIRAYRLAVRRWLNETLPQTIRRRWRALALAVVCFLAGTLFGAGALVVDPSVKADLLPFGHLQGSPAERVAEEEAAAREQQQEGDESPRATFASFLMTNNIRVSILALALGMTYGVGTIALMFYNGIILGAVGIDYLMAGQAPFLFGWLLPHGAIEIPAFIIGAQAGLVLAGALIGWGKRVTLRARLRSVQDDLMTLILGVAILLVWAGVVESFLSQYHEPIVPYAVKIGFGVVELAALTFYLVFAGRGHHPGRSTDE